MTEPRPCGCAFPQSPECECDTSCPHCWPDFAAFVPEDGPTPDGFLRINGVVRLSRLADGRVMCAACMEYKERTELFRNKDGLWDLCLECEGIEATFGTRKV